MKYSLVLLCVCVILVVADKGPGSNGGDQGTGGKGSQGGLKPQNCSAQNPNVACFINPCDVPTDCNFTTCKADPCTCTAHYFDADGNQICQDKKCPSANCDNSCDTGYAYKDGCQTCQCQQACNELCPQIACGDGEISVIPPGKCCPVCKPSCDNVACPQLLCVIGYHLSKGSDGCCPVCVPDQDCENVTCPMLACVQGYKTVKSDGECCPKCVPPLDCSTVICPDFTCQSVDNETGVATGYKAVVPDGQCCPVCHEDPQCHDVTCDSPSTCDPGYVLVKNDTDCCKYCQPKQDCSTVFCADIVACPNGSAIHTKPGDCCPSCTQCRPTDKSKCDNNDDPVCTPGYYTLNSNGTACEPVPEKDRKSASVELKVCPTNCTDVSADQLAYTLSSISGVGVEYLNVTIVKKAHHSCCWIVSVTVTDVSQTVDPNAIDTSASISAVVAAAEQTNEMTQYTSDNQNVSSASVASVSVLLVAALFAML